MFFYYLRPYGFAYFPLKYLHSSDEAQPYLRFCGITRMYALRSFFFAYNVDYTHDLRYTFAGSCTFSIHRFHTFIALRLVL